MFKILADISNKKMGLNPINKPNPKPIPQPEIKSKELKADCFEKRVETEDEED